MKEFHILYDLDTIYLQAMETNNRTKTDEASFYNGLLVLGAYQICIVHGPGKCLFLTEGERSG